MEVGVQAKRRREEKRIFALRAPLLQSMLPAENHGHPVAPDR